MKSAFFVSTSVAITLFSPLIMGQERPVSVALTMSSLVTDNSRKKDEDKESERQDNYQLGVLGQHENSYLTARVNYHALVREFDKDSQKTEDYLEGQGNISLGQETHLAALHISHRRKRLLNTPDALDVVENRQERDILSIAPEIRLGSPSSDRLLTQGQFTQIRFTDSKIQDADTEGGIITWSRPVSAISHFQLATQLTTTEFLYLPERNYDYTRADMLYAKSLRLWNYQLKMGHNRSERQEKTFDSPSFGINVGFVDGRHQWMFGASKMLTDTATGNGAGDSIGNDGLGRLPEQINREQLSASWRAIMICDRCSVQLTAAMTQDDYLEKDMQTGNSQYSGTFSYQTSPVSSLEFNYSTLKLSYSGSDRLSSSVGGNDYTFTYVSVGYQYTFANQVSIETFLRREEREQPSTLRSGYTENKIGTALNYRF